MIEVLCTKFLNLIPAKHHLRPADGLSAFGSLESCPLQSGLDAFGQPDPLLLCNCAQDRNHGIFEHPAGIQVGFSEGPIPDAIAR